MKRPKKKRAPESYVKRTYRNYAVKSGLVSSYVKHQETDLHILAESDVSEDARLLTTRYRLQIEGYIEKYPHFAHSLSPLPEDPLAPPIIRDMLSAAAVASVGPMAAVAGAIAQYVCHGLIDAGYKEVIVENGGDICLKRSEESLIAIFAGESELSNKIGIRIKSSDLPMGICTSSGTIGHSLSLGEADSVTVVSSSTVLADAAATRLGNEADTAGDGNENVHKILAAADSITGISGVLAICGEVLGGKGEIELVPLT
ncbi:MAG: UPF0280 family protein [Desulfobulbaceae bacterium]|nr:MAG: UPF0280 family protein [Desulfobulbaceae bacterium]